VASSQELSCEDYAALERELSTLGKFLVSLEGGEPLVREDVVEIVRIFSPRHLPMLYTNGWYVTDQLAVELFAAGLIQIGVSIDFPDAARHDAKRGKRGAFQRAWQAVARLREAAPHGGRQVHVMTVLMKENEDAFEELLGMSADAGVQHCVTVYSAGGDRREASLAGMPSSSAGDRLLALWKRYPHFKVFREYLTSVDLFLSGGIGLSPCGAGRQSFNIDHLGNLSPCIEKIENSVGNVRDMSMQELHSRLKNLTVVDGCQDCWTICRGFHQALGGGGSLQGWLDLAGRMRSV
jgi:MoaA/NifB/PqqE/SkfB family radical SAM enzyme